MFFKSSFYMSALIFMMFSIRFGFFFLFLVPFVIRQGCFTEFFFFFMFPEKCYRSAFSVSHTFLNNFYFFHCSWFKVFCQFLLYSKVTQTHIYTFFFSHYPPSKVTRYSTLCYTAVSYYLFIPNAICCIY